MPQFFIDRSLDVGIETEIRGADAKHLSTVLRLRRGDWLMLADASGATYRAEIAAATPRAVTVSIKERVRLPVSGHPPVIAQAIIKHDRIEGIIQKAVELGVREIRPFHSARTIPRLTQGITQKRLARWRTIAVEAAKQSGLPFRPTVDAPRSFDALVESAADFETKLIFWEGERERDLKSMRKAISAGMRMIVIIGPEGGFTQGEIERAQSAGAVSVSLGPQILRVETACVAALAICQYEAGGFAAHPS